MRESFHQKQKEALCGIPIRKKCCRYLWDGVMALPTDDPAFLTAEITRFSAGCRCENCKAILLRALFVRFGSMTDPMKRYHLEYAFFSEEARDAVGSLLDTAGFTMHNSVRRSAGGKEKWILYYKGSADMEDFLAYIGASGAAFEIMNAKIVKEFRNSVNRQVNCDTANIEKQLEASKKYVEAILFLTDSGMMKRLPETLQLTAKLRMENEQLSLAELGALCEPKVSKSGMKHRMEKLMDYAERIRQGESISE